MTWKVTFRQTDGTTASEIVEAASRKDVFARFTQQGISIISVDGVESTSLHKGMRAQASKSRWPRLLAATALAAVAVVVVVVWLRPHAEAPDDKPTRKSSRQIETVQPQRRTEGQVATQPQETDIAVQEALPPQKVGEIRDGKILMPSGELHVIKGEVTNSFSRSKGKWAIFNNPSENVIAATLCTVPGETLVGTIRFNGNFTKSFLKSLSTPIVVHEDDPEDVQALKRAVIEAKIALKDAYDRGEDIEQIIIDSREESQRMAQYKQQLKSNLFRVAKEAASVDEVDDALDAANLMLEDKGISPIEPGLLTRIKMKLLMNNGNEPKEN